MEPPRRPRAFRHPRRRAVVPESGQARMRRPLAMNLHILLILSYCLLLVLLGLWIGRGVKSAGAFFVAGRRLGSPLLFATLLAANIGAGSTVGAAGLGYRDGLAAWWWVGSAGLGSIVLGLWIGPRIWRVASEQGLHTVGDYLESRYGLPVAGLVSALLWLASLTILAAQLIALAFVLQAVAGIDRWVGCLIGGAVMTIYFAAGGLVSSAWVNLIQLFVLALGFAIAVPLVFSLPQTGGLQGVLAALPEESRNFWSNGGSSWILVAQLAPAFIVSPGLIQKAYGARGPGIVRLAVTAQGIVLLAFAFVPTLLGMASRVLHPDLSARELALPTLLTTDLPAWAGSIGLAAIVSAEISSADAILFMLSTSLSKDLYRRFLRPQASDREMLRVSRWAAAGGGALGVLIAVFSQSVVDTSVIFYSFLTLSLSVPIIAGLMSKRGGVAEAIAAIVAGVLAAVSVQLWLYGKLAAFNPFLVLLGLGVSGIAFWAVLGLRRGRRSSRADR